MKFFTTRNIYIDFTKMSFVQSQKNSNLHEIQLIFYLQMFIPQNEGVFKQIKKNCNIIWQENNVQLEFENKKKLQWILQN